MVISSVKCIVPLLLAWQWPLCAQAQTAAKPCQPRAGLLVPDLVTDHLYDLITLIEMTREESVTASARPSKYDWVEVYEDVADAAIVARKQDTCIAVFQATDFGNVFDIAQLFNWETDTIGGCTFRAGMVDAYLHSSYHDDFVAAVDRCMATNKLQKPPKLLLGGHSQGGAISVAASVDLKRYDPTVVTLGAVRSLVEPCLAETAPTKHYRFVNAVNGAYDYWTTVFNRNGVHIGHPILLDPNASPGFMASYTYLDDDFNREPTDQFNHDPDIYWLSISQWLAYERAHGCNDEIVVGGWEDGHNCVLASECTSPFCVNGSCQKESLSAGGNSNTLADLYQQEQRDKEPPQSQWP